MQNYTLSELSEVAHAIQEKENDQYRTEWERTRWLAHTLFSAIISPYTKKASQVKPKDLIVFPWEKEEEKQVEPNRNREDLFNKWDAEIKAKYGNPG